MELTDLGLEGEVLENVTKLLQSEGDKVRTEYSKKIRDLEGQIPKTLTPEEKALQDRIKALEDKEMELNKRERLNKVNSKLKEKGLNEELSKYLNLEVEDDGLDTYLDGISNLLNTGYVPKGHEGKSTKITKDQFKAMTLTERTKLYTENKTLYDVLSK